MDLKIASIIYIHTAVTFSSSVYKKANMLKMVLFIGHFIFMNALLFSLCFSSNCNICYDKLFYSYLDFVYETNVKNNACTPVCNQCYLKAICNCKLARLLCSEFRTNDFEENDKGTCGIKLNLVPPTNKFYFCTHTERFEHRFVSLFVLLAISVRILSLVGSFNSFKGSKLSWKIAGLGYSLKFVFQFQPLHTQKFQCYPSSIRNYFSDIDKSESVRKEKFMNYEWIRLSSFKEFPASSKVSSIRLAQSGFYYSGNGEEAICFCCGLRNDSWNTTETVNEIHRRLSPNCTFSNGEQTNNVAIHGNRNTLNEGSSNESSDPTEGASGGPEDISSENTRQYRIESTEPQQSTQHLPTSEDAVGVSNNVLTNSSREEFRSQIEQNRGRSRDRHINENRGSQCRFPGIVNEQPKHPEYVIKSVRLNSYMGWPSTSSVQPEALSIAGFFYAGKSSLIISVYNFDGEITSEHVYLSRKNEFIDTDPIFINMKIK